MSVTQSRQSTLGLDHFSKKFTHDNRTIKIQLWLVIIVQFSFEFFTMCVAGTLEALKELPASQIVITSLQRLVSYDRK